LNRRSSGFALILVIWSLVLLASVATGFAFAVRHEIRIAADLTSAAQAEAAATAALHTAVLEFSTPATEGRWLADGQLHAVPWLGAAVAVRISLENGRIDINRAPRELLAGLFTLLFPDGNPDALSDAVIDWRDKDDQPGPAGAERESYSRAGYGYGPPNAAFDSVNELGRVMGFDSRMVDLARPYITVYSGRPKVHAASADLLVLEAVPGIDQAAARAFVAQREYALDGDGKLDLTGLQKGGRYLDTGSRISVLSVDIDVRLNDGWSRRERAVIKLDRRNGYLLLARERIPTGGTLQALPDDNR
jgi:general secretion pathway protein K